LGVKIPHLAFVALWCPSDYFDKLDCLEIVSPALNQFGAQFPEEGVIHLEVPLGRHHHNPAKEGK